MYRGIYFSSRYGNFSYFINTKYPRFPRELNLRFLFFSHGIFLCFLFSRYLWVSALFLGNNNMGLDCTKTSPEFWEHTFAFNNCFRCWDMFASSQFYVFNAVLMLWVGHLRNVGLIWFKLKGPEEIDTCFCGSQLMLHLLKERRLFLGIRVELHLLEMKKNNKLARKNVWLIIPSN